MSNYRNFVSDFPNRCNDLLNCFETQARMRDREVTLMLSVATAGFTIPFERLRPPSENNGSCPVCDPQADIALQHHPAQDRGRYRKAAEMLDDLLKQHFKESDLWDPAHDDDWFFAKAVGDVRPELDSWPELTNLKHLSQKKEVNSVLTHIRNALAHGNIFTRALESNQLGLIVLLKRNCGAKFSMIAVRPHAFREFLRRWFDFLASADIAYGIIDTEQIA